ncbi:MAG: DNA repair photolyase [Saprospiraceae bacterium]|jgi:DNA repair photolyase|tara:strand:- start:4755 stop:5831 length:1077 start_codon:yes stop_codon:yes gene_type:complete
MKNEIRIKKDFIQGRGAQINPDNPFENRTKSKELDETWIDNDLPVVKTRIVNTYPRTIVNKVVSPDTGMEYSLNPYQGCEHGCVYCYARNTHTYWGYSSGTDFETTILAKLNAAELLEKKITSKSWKPYPIMLSGNTDCYQPTEKKLQLTRKLLQVFLDYKHPVGIVTKNSLILRDLDIIKELNRLNLISIAISVNTLDDKLRQKLEPRASSIHKRFDLIDKLSSAGLPVTVLAAPIIPGLNDHDIFNLVKKVASLGARRISHIVLRLNGDLPEIFSDWLDRSYPDRAKKVLNKIAEMHKGKLGNSVYGERMKGSGIISDMIDQQFKMAKRLYLVDNPPFEYNLTAFDKDKSSQMKLF